ncbi:MAM and LDL-receptor class A domain-containing protein 1-like isoform X3 [Dermacentor variabilis]|uniref:MAM and LDL-receptor class A domain-containing protein 1-like isoform X3 n=1 Tax=Dermacentor variabilis TaxID=34621 RepID=UPI003F5B9633
MVPDRGPPLLTMSSFHTSRVLALSLFLLFPFISVAAADTCTFENGICPEWVSTNCSREACFEARKVASMKLGPAYDHTFKTADGWSAYASTGTSKLGFPRAELSRKFKGPFCFTAWYHQSGTQAAKASFIRDHTMRPRKLFYSTQPDMAGRWQRVRYSEKVAQEFEIIIRYDVTKPQERGVFALDDLTLEKECSGKVEHMEPVDGSCDFDWGDTCGYDLGDKNSGWQLLQGERRDKFYSQDYNTDTELGGLLYLELKGNNGSGVLTSPKLNGSAETQCLDFHYYLPGRYTDTETEYRLDVAIQGSEIKKVWTWSSRELMKGSWTAADMAFMQENDFTVKLQCSVKGKGFLRSFCAIDAIQLRKCQGKRAENDGLCNFEDGWCTWKNRDPRWLLGGGNMKTTLASPANDHTFGNTTGSYVFFSNFEQRAGRAAQLISKILPWSNRITQCVEFWYIISGEKGTELKVLTRSPSETTRNHLPLWTQKSGTTSEWQQGRIAVPHGNQVVFQATVSPPPTPAFVALDDIAIMHHDRCETLPKGSEALSATELLSCDFNDWNLCRWSSAVASRKAWIFGVDPFSAVGPTSEPDSEKGDAVSVTGAALASLQGTVTLQSPNVGPQSELACFSVWYHMFASRGARLTVTLEKSPSLGGVKKPLWLLSQRGRTTSDRWYNVRRTVSLDGVNNKMQIAVQNAPSLRKDGLVALGPLKLTMGKCDVLTDGLGYCDFEFDTCGWTADPAWQRTLSKESVYGTGAFSGPSGSVYGIAVTAFHAPREGALLTSPEWSGQSQPQCLEFWYGYGGRTAPSLQVELKANGKSDVVWQMPLYFTKHLMLARVQILQEKKFQVVFRAKFGTDTTQYVDLDDVVLRPEPCVHPVECNFNDGICGYVNDFQENFRWLVGTGRYEQPREQPLVPRAKDAPPFAYLDLTAGKSDPKGPSVQGLRAGYDTVRLLSPLFDASNDNTQLSVTYYRRGPDITTANLSVSCYGKASDKAQTELQSTVGMPEVSRWTTLNVTVKRGASCQLAVKVTRGQDTNGTMAIASVQATVSETAIERNETSDSPTHCTFEDGTMCGWNEDVLSKQWLLNDPSNKLPEFPRSDHTLKAYKGRFVYAKYDIDYDYGSPVFKSPELDVNATQGACLSFWLFAVHSKHVSFTVWSGIDRLYVATAPSSHQWEHVLVNFKRPEGKFKLWIVFFIKQALVALDDIEVTQGYCPQRDFCSWEPGSSCPVAHGPGRFATWMPRNGSEIGFRDHTLKNRTGHYLYLNTTAVDSHHPLSRVFMWSRPPTEATCATFWFSGHGALGRLNVYRFTKETVLRDPLVSVSTPLTDGQWIARRVTIASRNKWNLVFEGVATPGVTTASGIMLDDIEFRDGECPPYEYCTFEDECLPWYVTTNGPGNGSTFEVERAGSFGRLPQDHTTQTEDGYYLLFKSPGTKGKKTSLVLREPLLYECGSLWYFLPKLSDGVALYVEDEQILNGTNVWKRYQWREASAWYFAISAVSGTNKNGFVAIDDVLISEQCNQMTRSTQRFDCGNQTVTIERVCDFVIDCANGDDERNCGACDFRDGLCGWVADSPLNRGPTAWRRKWVGEVDNSPLTKANIKRNGFYLLLHSNATRPTRRTTRAGINSPVIRNTNKLCTLTFWYNYILNGTRMDIDLMMRAGGYGLPVWTLSAMSETPAEGTWNFEAVEIGRYPSEISFYFSGVNFVPGRSMFAVDDIQYTDCALPAKQENCSKLEFRCGNGACVMGYERCNYVDDCGDNSDEQNCGDHRLSCNFDSSFCDWVPQAPADKKKKTWRLTRPSPFLLQSPTRDHTTGTPDGLFIMVGSRTTTNATIIGPTLDNSTFCAVTFFYAMQGKSEPSLKLVFRTTKDGPWMTAWTARKPSDFFHFASISTAFRSSAPYQVAFIGEHRIPDKQGYIAIDDVHFWESCKTYFKRLPETPVPTTPPFACGEKEFQCTGIKECIAKSKVCDFKEDCSNGADESRCGSCSFTTDLCGLENEDSGARFGWNWTKAEDGKRKQGFPFTDSRSNVQGAYAAYSLLNPEVPQAQMKGLATPKLGQIAHSCMVSFYAYLPNRPTAWLMFGVRAPPGNNNQQRSLTLLSAVTGTQGKGQWKKMYAKVGNWDAGARFVYMANTPGVSIDRPSYDMCHPDAQSEGREAAEKVTCTFSNPTDCGWFPENKVTDTKWVLYTGGSRLPGLPWQPPYRDSQKGTYMFARNTLSGIRLAHLVSVQMSPTPDTGRCFSFWYNMWQPNTGYLNLIQRVGNASSSLLWTRRGPQGKEWRQGQVQLNSDDPHQLVFEAMLMPSNPGMIAIDNFVLNDSRCNSDESAGVCNFEWDSCGWQLHNWERTSGRSSMLPLVDQSTKTLSGRYALAKAPGGRMVSPPSWYDVTQQKCLRFWYFLAGSRAETLNVTRLLNEGQEESLWFDTTFSGRSRMWYQASVNLAVYNRTPTIVFDATTSGDPATAVAVDDISLGNVPCPSPGSCSFEEDMCNWFNSKGFTYAQWYRHRGATVSNSSGVQNDHTLGTTKGYYLLLDAADLAKTSTGNLKSENLPLGPSACFKLYYFMKKDSGASLTVSFFGDTGPPRTVQATNPSQWTLLSIERSDLPQVFSVVITGRTAGGRSDVAIDDIDVRRGKCEGTPLTTKAPAPETTPSVEITTPVVTQPVSTQQTTSTEPVLPTTKVATPEPITSESPAPPQPKPALLCRRSEFNCRDGSTCIPAALLCDGVKDCPNGLDEKCGSTMPCKENEFFCATRSPSACLPRSLLCDGHEDCAGGSDESLCRACPPYLCLNDGICGWTPQAPSPTCDCRQGYEGRRCNLLASSIPEADNLTGKGSGSTAGVVTGIIVVLAIIFIAAVATFIFIRGRRKAQNSPVFLDNPSYDASTDETRIFN